MPKPWILFPVLLSTPAFSDGWDDRVKPLTLEQLQESAKHATDQFLKGVRRGWYTQEDYKRIYAFYVQRVTGGARVDVSYKDERGKNGTAQFSCNDDDHGTGTKKLHCHDLKEFER